MAADRRNASVVISLVVSMTLGLLVLLLLEDRLVPAQRDFSGSPLLMAQRGLRVAAVDVAYAESWTDVPALGVAPNTEDSVCLIEPDGQAQWTPGGPRIRLVVIGSENGARSERLGDSQKRTLLDVLGTLSDVSGRGLVPVRLHEGPSATPGSAVASQAADLRDFLALKGFIAKAPQ